MKIGLVLCALLLLVAGPAVADKKPAVPKDREAVPLTPPTPEYPFPAAYMGWTGRCDVQFNVDAYGYTKDIKPFCTHRIFCKSARDAIGLAQFEPRRERGRPVERPNVVYPLVYLIDNGTNPAVAEAMLMAKELTPCTGDPIS